jgi:LacI family transcriptional regulator
VAEKWQVLHDFFARRFHFFTFCATFLSAQDYNRLMEKTSKRASAKLTSSSSVSLDDVARHAGVSPATVSRALNGTAGVRAEMMEKVRRACEELGYMPNGAARALSTRRSRTIGAIVPSIENEGFARTISALQRRLKEAEYSLLLACSDYDPAQELHEARLLLSRGIDGIVLVGGAHDPALLPLIRQQKIPVVETWTLLKDQPSVGFDNALAAYQLTDYLVSLGHRKIGIIAGRTSNNDRASARAAGVRECLDKHGLKLHAELYVERPYLILEGKSAMQTMMSTNSAPTAVVCANDQIAFGALIGANALGLSVPGDVSIAGFNDVAWSAHINPPLTTVKVPAEEIGRASANFLLNCLAGETVVNSVEVPVNLIVRGSTAPPPARKREISRT